MLENIQKRIEELHMIESGDTILVGVSGGADSVCLLYVLSHLRQNIDFMLEVIHVEHGIRGEESRQDAAFVEALCQRMQIPLHMRAVDVPAFCGEKKLGVEEAARILRYREFVSIAKEKGAKIALAHHMEDNAETILFQLARGSSLTGLCGMQPIRRDDNDVVYIRPLLHIHRKEIEEFLEHDNQEYCIDATNQELDYSRNYIRNRILPELEKVNLQAVEHINRTSAHLSEIRDYFIQEVDKSWKQVVQGVDTTDLVFNNMHADKQRQKIIIDIKRLQLLHPALQKEIIYKAITHMMGTRKDVTQLHVMDVLDLTKNQSGKRVHLPDGLFVQKEYHQLIFSYQNMDILQDKGKNIYVLSEMLEQLPQDILLNENGEKLRISAFSYDEKKLEIPLKPYTKWMDYDKIKKGFCIRTRRSGDVFIGDSNGHRKKLKQYMIDEKIPASKRDSMWLLAQEDVVLWLIGGRMSEHVKVTADTKTIIEFTYDGGY